MRIGSPQTAEDAEQLREYADAFVAEHYPAPAGPDPASVAGATEYAAAAGPLREAYGRETAAAHAGWAAGVRDQAGAAGAPRPGETGAAARSERAETKTDMIVRGAAREARESVTKDETLEGRAGVAVETEKPFEEHATENLPFIGGWLAGKLFGTAKNETPDGAADETTGAGGEESPPPASPEDRRRWRHGE